MSIDYRIDGDLVIVIPYGVNTFEGVCGLFESVIADPAFKPPAKILFDARHTDYGPPSEELEMLAEFLAKPDAFKKCRWAVVANPDTLVYGLSRMFCCLAESQGIFAEPFADCDEARRWLLNPNWDDQVRKGLQEHNENNNSTKFVITVGP